VHCVCTVCSLCVHCVCTACLAASPVRSVFFIKPCYSRLLRLPKRSKHVIDRVTEEGRKVRVYDPCSINMAPCPRSRPALQAPRAQGLAQAIPRKVRSALGSKLSFLSQDTQSNKQKHKGPSPEPHMRKMFFLMAVFGEGTWRVVAVLSGETSIVGVPVKEVLPLMRNRNRTELHFLAL
jgi:hypothetical protein